MCTKMLKKLSEKLSKISCDYMWLLHGKTLPVSVMLSQNFLNWKQAQWKVTVPYVPGSKVSKKVQSLEHTTF